MIVKMKKITLLLTENQRKDMLKSLRSLGVMHVQNIKKPSVESMHEIEEAIAHAETAAGLLGQRKEHSARSLREIDQKLIIKEIDEIIFLDKEAHSWRVELAKIKEQTELFKPWGGFDPKEIENLKSKGVFVNLYALNKRQMKELTGRPDIYIINDSKRLTHIAHITKDPNSTLPFKKARLPEHDFEDLYREGERLQTRLDDIGHIQKTKRAWLGAINGYLQKLQQKRNFLDVSNGMAQKEGLVLLQGFCPEHQKEQLLSFAKKTDSGCLIEDPKPADDVPTLIKNPRWIKIIEPVFKFMNTVPGYAEYDISLWFLLFFSLFFAMLIGDAGYGVIFFVVTFFAHRKFKTIPPQPFFLMYVLSVATIAWGLATGTWFGSEKIASLPGLNFFVVDRISSFAVGNQDLMIYICFSIGVIQLSIAHLIRAIRMINSLRALAEAGWIFVLWGLYFVAGTLVINKPFPAAGGYVLLTGILLLLLFSNPQKNILKGIGLSLVDIPLKIIGSFADVVSYLRLFAVGYASFVLASTFNNMALSLGFNSILTGLGAALILFLGHTLNIVLGFMAVIVHGVRLNMLEFSGQMGMEWSGREYTPFKE